MTRRPAQALRSRRPSPPALASAENRRFTALRTDARGSLSSGFAGVSHFLGICRNRRTGRAAVSFPGGSAPGEASGNLRRHSERAEVPDLAAWRAEHPPELDAAYITVPPVWVCEVVSPSSTTIDRGPKADLYARVGVDYLWLVEPLENLIEAYRREGDAWLRLGAWAGEVSARIPPFDAVELELGPLWVKKNPNLQR